MPDSDSSTGTAIAPCVRGLWPCRCCDWLTQDCAQLGWHGAARVTEIDLVVETRWLERVLRHVLVVQSGKYRALVFVAADVQRLYASALVQRVWAQLAGSDSTPCFCDLDNSPATVAHKIWTVQIGDAVIVAHPGEAYSAFQSELRRRFPERAIIVANLTNGPGFVYLPDAQAYRRNAYQAWQTPLAEGALEMLTEAAAAAIASATLR